MDEEQNEFLQYWFAGFMNGLQTLDENSQEAMLNACGLACALSYTAQVFVEGRQLTSSIPEFLDLLATKFPGSSYEMVGEHQIKVTYHECACDLVKKGWVKNPLLCRCSVSNLQQNFENSLLLPVHTRLISSILGGATQCEFEVLIGEADE